MEVAQRFRVRAAGSARSDPMARGVANQTAAMDEMLPDVGNCWCQGVKYPSLAGYHYLRRCGVASSFLPLKKASQRVGFAAELTLMIPIIDTTAFDRAIDPVLRILSHEQVMRIADFHVDEKLQQRIEVLARRANEGELSHEDRAEYEGYAQANRRGSLDRGYV